MPSFQPLNLDWAGLRRRTIPFSSGFLALSLLAFVAPQAGRNARQSVIVGGGAGDGESARGLAFAAVSPSSLGGPVDLGVSSGEADLDLRDSGEGEEGDAVEGAEDVGEIEELAASAYLLRRNLPPKTRTQGGIEAALRDLGVAEKDATEIARLMAPHRGAAQGQTGEAVAVEFNQLTGAIGRCTLPLESDLVIIERDANGSFAPRREPIPFVTRVARLKGVIRSSFSQSARAKGLSAGLTDELVDIFGWEIDFRSHLRRGDAFEVVYEAKYLEGERHHDGPILAAKITTGGVTHSAFRFEDANGKGEYFDGEGRSLRQSFLKFPVRHRSISSRFQQKRFHPILRIVRPHDGVDLAAPYGTPVRAAGDGVVEFAGWKGEYGRLVVVRHNLVFSTWYGHMSGFAAGIVPGKRVAQGQVIGTVGASGLATGPHLHYGISKNGRFIDPMSLRIPPRRVLKGAELARFQKRRDELLAMISPGGSAANLLAQASPPGRGGEEGRRVTR